MKISVSQDILGFKVYGYFDFGGYLWREKLKTHGYLHFFEKIFCETLDLSWLNENT